MVPVSFHPHHPLAFSSSPHKNTVGIEHKVDVMTILVAKSGAQSYLEESMLVVAAAGIAARRTDSCGESPVTIPHLYSA